MTRTHSQLPNAHLPQLTPERLEQMAALACNYAQETSRDAYSSVARASFLQRFFTPSRAVFAGFSVGITAIACAAIVMITPVQPPANTDITYSETTISEHIIQDFLDEMV